ncbi:MAG: guanylate kinase [Planctomycetales bacterium]|nr:guanylate kinase [Planctomycetales bacterium]MCA9228833.1 guanylate kinase [Planctomycetales bacterium]
MRRSLGAKMETTAGTRPGKLVIISGPSGAGKSTVVRRLLDECPAPIELSVSATTRAPRPGEQDGVEYFFLSHEEFARRRAEGGFLECKEVFGQGNWYGTPRCAVTAGLQAGKWVVLEIDVQGMAAVVEQMPDAITIFVHPGSAEELERRLRGRGTESAASLERRLEVAKHEMACLDRYQYQVINDTVDRAVREICEILIRNGAQTHA